MNDLVFESEQRTNFFFVWFFFSGGFQNVGSNVLVSVFVVV